MTRRAFSLIELLLAVFILGLGIISIAALFPAGILQQQMANDEQMGPLVAEHALNVIRSRVKPEDFGSFEQFGIYNVGMQSQGGVWRPQPGDWSWIRPAVWAGPSAVNNYPGAVDIFAARAEAEGGATGGQSLVEFQNGLVTGSGGRIYGIPYNTGKYGTAPLALITQRERYWPMVIEGTSTPPAQVVPQYVWDVMFRRFGGRVQVGIFVYRVVAPGGGTVRDHVANVTIDDSRTPPVPYRRMTGGNVGGNNYQFTGFPSTVPDAWVQSTPPAIGTIPPAGPFTNGRLGTDYLNLGDDPVEPQNAWQLPGQWLVDNNGNVVRVSQGRKLRSAPPESVLLSAPIPRVPNAQPYADYENENVRFGVRSMWYVPAVDAFGNQLIPVYATVRDL